MAKKNESAIDRLIKKLTKATPIEQESSVKLDHDFDGIQELNNPLPPWWTIGFVITVVISVFYIFYYTVQGKDSQYDEYKREMANAKAQVEKYKKDNNIVDKNSVTLLTDKNDLAAGKEIYMKNCVACHLADGGGIVGPNLTDENWIYGCDIKTVFGIVNDGTSQGMQSFKTLGAKKVQQVASYVLSLKGTKPAKPKAPQGEPCN
jgi:cytochrome c oxidase cbb3-type subunit 3